MEESTEMPAWLSDIVVRLKSGISLTIDNLGQLKLSDSLKGFLIEILQLVHKEKLPTTQGPISA